MDGLPYVLPWWRYKLGQKSTGHWMTAQARYFALQGVVWDQCTLCRRKKMKKKTPMPAAI